MDINKIVWTKMSGANNSFWITHFIPSTLPSLENQNWGAIAQSLCQKNNIVKTDGLVVLIPDKKYDFKWLFYNANGSPAEMCGNAACCVTAYAFKHKLTDTSTHSVTFKTASQIIKGELYKGSARIFLKQNTSVHKTAEIIFNKKKYSYSFINSGVPHGVIKIQKWPCSPKTWEPYKMLAQYLRPQTTYHPHGMNISFYSLKNDDTLYGMSFERGLEDFTPACGTGALAIAQVYRLSHLHLSNIFVNMPGGKLQVGFPSDKIISLMSPIKWL